MKLVDPLIHQSADGRFRVRIILHRKGTSDPLHIESELMKSLEDAKKWRDANRPARLVSGVKAGTKIKRFREPKTVKAHECIICRVPTPETLCPACKTAVQADAVEILMQ